jgi:hypothetical protein
MLKGSYPRTLELTRLAQTNPRFGVRGVQARLPRDLRDSCKGQSGQMYGQRHRRLLLSSGLFLPQRHLRPEARLLPVRRGGPRRGRRLAERQVHALHLREEGRQLPGDELPRTRYRLRREFESGIGAWHRGRLLPEISMRYVTTCTVPRNTVVEAIVFFLLRWSEIFRLISRLI